VLRVGLTGGIASGKSMVAEHLASLGAVVVDADVLAREVVAPGTAGLAAVVARFGSGVTHDGGLNREALGRIVFADPAARSDLERIIHPAVRERAAALERAAPRDAVVVHVIPLLVETGQQNDFDLVVVVDCDHHTQVARLRHRNELTAEQAQARLAAQVTREERLAAADVVLANDGSPAELRAQAEAWWADLDPSA
jgi:dephospho-CoA kinase